MIFAYGEPITVTKRTQTGLDEYGDPVYSTSTLVRKGALNPEIGHEVIAGQDQVITQPQAVFVGQDALDVAAFIDSNSKLTIDGTDYEVDGTVKPMRSPFTGWHAGLVVPLKRVTG